MTHVVTENCIKCKHTDCVAVCPVDCFHEGPNFLVIDPEVCIDCGVCIPECPIDAIVIDDDKKVADLDYWINLNKDLSAVWPVLRTKKDPLPDHTNWKDKPNKRELLEK